MLWTRKYYIIASVEKKRKENQGHPYHSPSFLPDKTGSGSRDSSSPVDGTGRAVRVIVTGIIARLWPPAWALFFFGCPLVPVMYSKQPEPRQPEVCRFPRPGFDWNPPTRHRGEKQFR